MHEPDPEKHWIFDSFEEAYEAYLMLPEESRETIDSPRQSHGCWIFNKYEQE